MVAYVAFLFGLGIPAQRLSDSARQYLQKFVKHDEMFNIYSKLGRKSELEARQKRGTVEQLRLGKIPNGLLPGQAEFLRSLDIDPNVTPEYRKYRRDLITEGEEQTRTRQERNAIVFGDVAEYHRRLAAKYDKARWRPWLPVEPDPPMPPSQ